MRKAIIVDDEESIREGLPYLIDWEHYGYEIVGTAANGQEGLELIRAVRPDVVIADIRMPGKTGLAMIQEAFDEKINFYAIILSGYSDFSYAQKAIQLGAKSYLLKPIDEDELIKILETITTKDAATEKKQLKNLLMDKIFGGDESGLPNFSWVKLLRFSNEGPMNVLAAHFQTLGFTTMTLIHRYHYYLALMSEQTGDEAAVEAACIELAPEQEILVARAVSAADKLQPLAIDLLALSKMIFLLPEQLISNATLKKIQKEQQLNKDVLDKVLEAMLANEELAPLLAQYRGNFYFSLAFEENIKWQVAHEMSWLVQQLQDKLSVAIPWERERVHQEIYLQQSFPALMELLATRWQEIQAQLRVELNTYDIIDEIIDYTKKHFQEDLSLKKIGDNFNYNSAYLGKKFRRETGKTYLTFLEEVRMEKAADILQNSNLMVYEVSERVGYSNVDYFYKKFKQYFNVSPNEFRRK